MPKRGTDSREVTLLGEDTEYIVRQSSDASEPRIDVDIHGVTVVVPTKADIDPETVLQENAAWVREKQRTYESYREQAPERRFEAGESFPYLGENYELVVEQRPNHEIGEDTIRLRKSAVAQSTIEGVLRNVYRREARDHFTTRADFYAAEMGVEYAQIEIRNQRTKWGSCSTTGTLGLNWRLIMAPSVVVDYVIVHELAHLMEQAHNDQFWEFVAGQIPDYREHASWLEENSTKLIFTQSDL